MDRWLQTGTEVAGCDALNKRDPKPKQHSENANCESHGGSRAERCSFVALLVSSRAVRLRALENTERF